MKQKFLNLKSWLLMMCLLVGVSSAWAEDQRKSFKWDGNRTYSITDNSFTASEVVWTFSVSEDNGANGGYIPTTATKSDNRYGLKFGNSGQAYYGKVTFTTDFFKDVNVKSVAMSVKNNGQKIGTLTATQGSTTIGTASNSVKTSNWETLTASGTTGNKGSLTVTYEVDQACSIESIIVTYEQPTVAYTVSFDAGTNGTCSTTSLTEASANAGVTLPSCTPNDGYAFLGWTATKDKATIDTGLTAGSTYKPSSTITLYAVYSHLYTVSFEAPQNGTLVIKAGENPIVSGSQVVAGTALSVECTPADGYKFRNWQYKVGDNSWTTKYSATQDFDMPDGNTQFRANFDEIVYRTISWRVNGDDIAVLPIQVEDGADIPFPTELPEGLNEIYGKKFVGWSANENASSADDLVVGKVPATADATYFAVFADVVKSGESEIILDYKNVHSAYTTDNVDRNMQDVDGFKYYGCMQGKESGSSVASILQMRKTSNNEITSWIYNSTALDIKKLEITYTSSNNKLCDVFFGDAENPSEDAASCDGEANAAGKNIFTNADGCKYFRIENPKNGAIYISKIVVYCNDEEVTNYTTTVAPIYTLDELSNVSRGEHVNVAVDAEITSVSRTNPVDNLYQVIIKSENNNTVILKIDDADFNWLVGGRVTGTLYDVEWSGVDRGWFISGKSNDYWKALEYTAPVVNTYESIEALRSATLDDNTTVNVTLNDKIANVELVGDTYYVTLDNDFQIVSVTYRDLGWEIGGTISGTLNNVVYSNSGSVDGVLDLNGAYKSLEYKAPVSTYGVTISGDIENGTVTADKSTAAEGETVTLTITPEEGYTLAQLMVYTDDDDIEVVDNKFVMPAADVEVYAYFAQEASETYTLSEFAEAANAEEDAIAPGSMVSVSFDNEIVQIDNSEEAASILLKDGDNTFVLMADESCSSDWVVGGTLAGSWNAMYYGQNPMNGAYMLYYADENDPWSLTYTKPKTIDFYAAGADAYYVTFSNDKAVTIPDMIEVGDEYAQFTVYSVYAVGNMLELKDLTSINYVESEGLWYLSENEGYLIKAEYTGDVEFTGNKAFSVVYTELDYKLNGQGADNFLRPASEPKSGNNKYYMLAYSDSNYTPASLGFYWGAASGAAFESRANSAYLALPNEMGAPKGFRFVDSNATAIKSVENKVQTNAVYNLAGQRVSTKGFKGIVIKNGKKVLNK